MVAIEPRSYREAIGSFLQNVRESLEVFVVDPDLLEAEVSRFEPDLVFSSCLSTSSGEDRPAWAEFHPEGYGQAVTLHLNGEHFEIGDADLGDLLSIVDRAERSLARSARKNRR